MSESVRSGAATQVSSPKFDFRFFGLSPQLQDRLQKRIDDLGRRLGTFPHYRMQGADTYRLRVGDYRVIYQFDTVRNEVLLIALGHRSDIYRAN